MESNNFSLYLLPLISLVIGIVIGIIIPIFTKKSKKEVVLPEFYLEFTSKELMEHALHLLSVDAKETADLAKQAKDFGL